MNFSLFCRSRNRPKLLINFIERFITLANKPSLIEIFVGCDLDDKSILEVEDYVLNSKYNIVFLKQKRSRAMHRDYDNRMATMAKGSYIWGLNDECDLELQDWDLYLKDKIETYLRDKPDRICYVALDDSTHNLTNYCNSFPLLTRETIQALGCFIPQEINCWGGDWVLLDLLQNIKANRILYATEVKIQHRSGHNLSRGWDDGYEWAKKISHNHSLTSELRTYYISKLNQWIDKC